MNVISISLFLLMALHFHYYPYSAAVYLRACACSPQACKIMCWYIYFFYRRVPDRVMVRWLNFPTILQEGVIRFHAEDQNDITII